VARQLLAESGVLAAIGGVASLALVYLGQQWLQAGGPHPEGAGRLGAAIPLLDRLSVDARTLAVTSAVCILVVIVSGVAPALRASRRGSLGFVGSGALAARARHGRFHRDVLVAGEVALALVLLLGVGLLGTSLARLYDLPLGFEPRDVVAMSAELPRAGYMSESGAVGTPRARWAVRPEHPELVRDLVRRLEKMPEVEGASVIHILPFRSRPGGHSGNVHVEGAVPQSRAVDGVARTEDAMGRGHNAMLRVAAPGYFAAMDIPVLAGRDFSWSDDARAPAVAIVDEELADWYWPEGSAVGRRIQARVGQEWRAVEVVGVVGAVWQDGFSPSGIDRESPPRGPEGSGLRRRLRPGFLYLPYAQPASAYRPFDVPFLTRINLVVRHRGTEQRVAAVMAEALRDLDPVVPIVRLESMEASVARSAGDRRFQLLVLGGFSAVALVLALIGVYGVMTFHVNRRVHEIGVRMALGARAAGVVREVVGDGIRVALLGSLLGVAGAMAGTRLLSRWLFGVAPTEPSVFVGLGISMVIVAVLASWIPARSAARVDPMACLRSE
jgi:putative ABC transport system permease protein